ncbi:MAG: protein-L-isoaspartate(D-aspartate) O-methyltransferase [Pseudomonadota bacterium]
MTSQRTRDRLVDRLVSQGIQDARVLELIGKIPRHIFIEEALAHRAYEDTALPIGHGQTISQPYIVALMSQTLFNIPRAKILEVGTGCGYQTALLAHLADSVYSVERIEALMPGARERFGALGINNVHTRIGDGYEGWERFAPFDGIIVTAAPPEIPQALLAQITEGGRLVMPVGNAASQHIQIVDNLDGDLVQSTGDAVRFVPMLRGIA